MAIDLTGSIVGSMEEIPEAAPSAEISLSQWSGEIAVANGTATTMVTVTVPDPVPVMPQPDSPPQFDRMKGAKWFGKARTNEVMILGQGGIGSWLTLMISRLGCVIYTWDMDRYETHNMTGQLVRGKDIGKLKTTAIIEICREFNDNSPTIYPNAEFTAQSYAHHTMLNGFDNMDARKIAFMKWKEYVRDIREVQHMSGAILKPEDCFFQDGRLTAEQLQIFNITGDRLDLIDLYEKEYLFEDKEGFEGDCTFKQTSHAAAMIASHMVGFYTNWLTNRVTGDKDFAKVPFKYEYIIPYNLTMQDYVNT